MIRPQYHFRQVDGRGHVWNVRKLLEAAENLPVIDVPLTDIAEIHEPYWFGETGDVPTCARIMAHAKQVEEVDLSYPILLCAEGRVMDGMHRIMKAHGENRPTIAARKLIETPPPDYIDPDPDTLPYD